VNHPSTDAFVKNSGMGFAIPYLHNGEPHDYLPDFVVRLKANGEGVVRHVILETKGYDPLESVKTAAARGGSTPASRGGVMGRAGGVRGGAQAGGGAAGA
jgi:type III restriction enzyme